MKKIIALLCVFALFVSSCSSDEVTVPTVPTPSDISGVLLKRIVEKDENNNVIETEDYTYNGNKLLKILLSDGSYYQFTYVGDLITEVKKYDSSDVLTNSEEYAYNSSNKLISYITKSYEFGDADREVFVYNLDGTVTANTFTGDLVSQTSPSSTYTKLFFQNSEVLKIERYNASNDVLLETSNFTYDEKNNPNRNILGYDKLYFTEGSTSGNLRNLLTSDDAADPYYAEYTYNSNNFPTIEIYKGLANEILGKYEYTYF